MQFQLVVTGHLCHAAVKNDVLVRGTFAAHVCQPKVKTGTGSLRPRRLGVGGGIQNQVRSAARGGPKRCGKRSVQKRFQFPDSFRLVVEGSNGVSKECIAEGGCRLLRHHDPLGGNLAQLIGQIGYNTFLPCQQQLVHLLIQRRKNTGYMKDHKKNRKNDQQHGEPVQKKFALHPYAFPLQFGKRIPCFFPYTLHHGYPLFLQTLRAASNP